MTGGKPIPPTDRRLLLLGYGYLGRRLGETLHSLGGWEIVATSREGTAAAESSVRAARMELAEMEKSEVWSQRHTHAVYMIAPGRGGDPALGFYRGAVGALERLAAPALSRFLYISSTGVYAQRDGSGLDETDPAETDDPRKRFILQAEEALLDRARNGGLPVSILRLGGIYGPGRSPTDWLAGDKIKKRMTGSAHAYMNWIHVEDAANAIAAALVRARPGEIYNIVDDTPSQRGEIYEYAAGLAGVDPQTLDTESNDRGKRISNRKAREELGWAPEYPSYREGLSAIIGEAD